MLYANPANAQKKDVRFRHISLEQGLSQSAVTDIVQDSADFMWFSTRDGLNRYDGYSFKVFRNQPEDSNSVVFNDINCLKYDSKSQLWIGTRGGGLDMFMPATDSVIHIFGKNTLHPSGETGFVNAISEDPNNIMWAATGGGLVKYNTSNKTWQLFRMVDGDTTSLPSNNIMSIINTNDNYLYVGTFDRGLCRFDKRTGKCHRFPYTSDVKNVGNSIYGNYVLSLSLINNKIWVGTEHGINTFNLANNQFEFTNARFQNYSPLTYPLVNRIFADPEGGIWLSSLGAGMARLDTTNWSIIRLLNEPTNKNSLSYNAVNVIFRSRVGNLWIGTNGNGIDFINKYAKFELYKIDPSDDSSLSHPSIRCILKDHNGNTYVGGYGGLSIYYKNGAAKKFKAGIDDRPHKLINLAVYSLLEDTDGTIWVGTEGGGIQVYNPASGLFTKLWQDVGQGEFQLPDNNIYKLFLDSNNDIWIGTTSGLARFNRDSNTFSHYLYQLDGKPSKYPIRDIFEIDANHFWIATDKGLVYFEKSSGKFELFRHERGNPNSINSDAIYCIRKTKRGDFWIGTNGGGLNKIILKAGSKPVIESVKHFTTMQGMPSNVVYGMLEDNKGTLWISTNSGICWLDSLEHITVFNIYDGLQSNEFNTGAYYKDKDGTMYFGGINGLNSFNPDKMLFNKQKPRVAITGFKVFNKDRPMPMGKDEIIRLESNEDFFSFEFAALDFTIPEKNEYAYKLEGFDDDWVYCGNRHYASYTNLPPGDYVFRVKASNSDHYWNNTGATVRLTIVPPFWRNKWFLIFLSSILAVVITILLRIRISRLQEQQKFLEEKVKMQSERLKMEQLKTEIAVSKALIDGQNIEQKRISEDLHDGLGQTLTAASLNLMAIEGSKEMSPKDAERVESMRQLLQSAIVEVRNISHNLMPNLMAEEGLEAALTELCNRTMKSSKLDVILKVQDLPAKLGNNLEISFYRIVQEIINNTLKHSGAKNLFISIIYRNNRILMETEDNGIGFDSAVKEHKGLGLKNIGIRVEILNGVYHIHSVPGRGTLISIEIPTTTI